MYHGQYHRKDNDVESIPVAVKVIDITHDLLSVEDQIVRLFHNELYALTLLAKHPHIIHCIGYINQLQDLGRLQLVLELSSYGSLSSVLYDVDVYPMLPMSLQIAWCLDIISALDFMHSQHMIHRDINADNCLLTTHLHVKVCDFGLALHQDTTTENHEEESFVGTKEFIAPEIFHGHIAKPSSDIYSFAITVLQIGLRLHPESCSIVPMHRNQWTPPSCPSSPSAASTSPPPPLSSSSGSCSPFKHIQNQVQLRQSRIQDQIIAMIQQWKDSMTSSSSSSSLLSMDSLLTQLQSLLIDCLHYESNELNFESVTNKRPSTSTIHQLFSTLQDQLGSDPRVESSDDYIAIQRLEHTIQHQQQHHHQCT